VGITDLKTGIFHLPTYDRHEDLRPERYFDKMCRQTQQAERLGFTGAWFAEHHFQAHGGLLSAPSLLMAAIARATKSIRLGYGIIQVPFHNPLSLAEQVCTLDCISDGRVDIGIGRGFLKCEYDGFELSMNESRRRFYENTSILRLALDQDQFSFEGEFHRLSNISILPKPMQKPHPPLWMAAGLSPESFEWAGRQGFKIMLAPFLAADLSDLKKNLRIYRQAWAEAGNPEADLDVLVNVHVHVSVSHEEAKREASEALYRYVAKTREAGASAIAEFHAKGVPADFSRYPVLGRRWSQFRYETGIEEPGVIIGPPSHCLQKIRQLVDELGCTYLLGSFDFGQEAGAVLRSMESFIEFLS
jgi:natural product biosynthesis luciferase-like monooxygenase protein